MKSLSVTFFAMALFVSALSGCGGGTTPNANGGNAASGNSTNPLETKTPAADQVKNNAPTLTPTFKAYCEAWKTDNEAALRKIYSSDTIKHFEEQMKEDKIKSLIKFLEDDKVSGEPCDVINEEINGDTAVGTIRSNKYPRGIAIEFVKENGEWKLTNKAPGSVTQQAANTNSAPK